MNTSSRCALISATLVAATAMPLSAQATASINGRLLPIGVDTFTVSYSGTVIGRGIMARSRASDTEVLQVYEWRSAGGEVIVDSLFSDIGTLRPIREIRVIADTVIEATFRSDSIHVITRPRAGGARQQSVPGSTSVYSSATLEALAAAAPLAEGYERDFRVYYAPPAQRGFVVIRIRVEGTDAVPDRSRGMRNAWIVSASTPGGGTTYWIDKATRTVLKYDTREGPATIEFRR